MGHTLPRTLTVEPQAWGQKTLFLKDTSLKAPVPYCLPPTREVLPERGLEPCGQPWMNAGPGLQSWSFYSQRCCPPTVCFSLTPASTPLHLNLGWGWGGGVSKLEKTENMPF